MSDTLTYLRRLLQSVKDIEEKAADLSQDSNCSCTDLAVQVSDLAGAVRLLGEELEHSAERNTP